MVMVVFLLPRLVPIYYMTILTSAFVQVIVSSIRTNRARCTLYKKILGENSDRASVKIQREVLLRIFEKVSGSVTYYSICLSTNIYKDVYGHQHRSLYPAHAAHMGN